MLLCHTMEFIGSKDNIVGHLASRSSSRRNGLSFCQCAGKGDVGYRNIWTLEVTNDLNVSIPLVIGRRYVQMAWFKVEPLKNKGYDKRGKYDLLGDKITNDAKYNELFNLWNQDVDCMLPKMYKDWELNQKGDFK